MNGIKKTFICPVCGAEAPAKAAACLSQLKQIGLAVTAYGGDFSGWFFSPNTDSNTWALFGDPV